MPTCSRIHDVVTMLLCIAALCSVSEPRVIADYYDDYAEDVPEAPAAVAAHNITDFQNYLVRFLDGYYEKYVRPRVNATTPKAVDIYEQMQSDQPVTQNVNIQSHNGTDYSALKRG